MCGRYTRGTTALRSADHEKAANQLAHGEQTEPERPLRRRVSAAGGGMATEPVAPGPTRAATLISNRCREGRLRRASRRAARAAPPLA